MVDVAEEYWAVAASGRIPCELMASPAGKSALDAEMLCRQKSMREHVVLLSLQHADADRHASVQVSDRCDRRVAAGEVPPPMEEYAVNTWFTDIGVRGQFSRAGDGAVARLVSETAKRTVTTVRFGSKSDYRLDDEV